MAKPTKTGAGCTSLNLRQPSKCKIPFVLAILVIVCVPTIAATSNRNKTKKVKSNDVCLTPYCIKAAKNLLASMDESVDPCEDFYQFACGKWLNRTKIPKDDYRWSTTEQMASEMNNAIVDLLTTAPSNEAPEPESILNARRLYKACLNETNIEIESVTTLLALIDREFGGWPIIQSSTWNDSDFRFDDLWFNLSQYTKHVFYYVETRPDVLNASVNAIYFLPSRLSLGFPSLYNEKTGHPKAYRRFIRELALALNANSSTVSADVNDIFQFEKELSNYHRLTDNQPVGDSKRLAFHSSLLTTEPYCYITDHLRRLYRSKNVTLIGENFLIIKDVRTLENVLLIIAKTPPRVLQNYMVLRFLMSQIPHMPKRFRTISHKFQQVTLGVRDQKPRTIVCARYVNENMGYAISKLYINKYFDASSRRIASELVSSIRNSFIDMINQSDWMDPDLKNATIQKVRTIDEEVGYEDYLNDKNGTTVESMYAEYNFNASHIQNFLTILRLNVKRNLQRLPKAVNYRELHDVPPTSVNAFYYPPLNRIVISSAILQPPHFHKDAPKYLNYGSTGTIIGHEIAHGFSDLRHPLHKINNTLWRLNQTIDRLEQRSKCLIKQYDNYTKIQANNQTYGKRTIEENTADNEGLNKAYIAYQKWKQESKTVEKKLPGLTKYSAEQLFFLSFGHIYCSKQTDNFNYLQTAYYGHPLSPLRVLGPTSNFDKFDQAFNCKPGQGNSRVNKCSLW